MSPVLSGESTETGVEGVEGAGMGVDADADLNQAAELARLAGEAAPQKVDYLLLLGRIYEQASLTKRALATYERALQLDPKSEAAKKAVRALK